MPAIKSNYHTTLASYFASKPLYLDEPTQKKPNTRKLVEQPWQLLKSKLWNELKNLLENDIIFWLEKAEISNIPITDSYRYWCNLADQAYEPFNIVQKIDDRLVNITEIDNNSQTVIIIGISNLIKIWNYTGVLFICATDNDVYSIDVQNGFSRHLASINNSNRIADVCIDESKLIIGVGIDNGVIETYDYISGVKMKVFYFGTVGKKVGLYFQEGKIAIIATGDFWTQTGTLDLWDINTGNILIRKIIPWSFNCLLLTPSNKLIWIDGENKYYNISK